MVLVVAIHSVRDFTTWRQAIERTGEALDRQGVVRASIFRAVDEPNEVLVALEMTSRAQDEALLRDPTDYRDWFDRAGLDVYPSIFVGELVETIEHGAASVPSGDPPRAGDPDGPALDDPSATPA
jgi:hypothetical protein